MGRLAQQTRRRAMAQGDLRGRFLWYELMTSDPKAAEGFYGEVVGWEARAYPGMDTPYTTWMKGETPVGGLMTIPAEAKAGGAPPNWLMYVGTPDADATVQQVKSLGGTVEAGPMEIGGIGRFAVVADPQGAVFAVLQPAEEGAMPEGPAEVLEFSWRELATTDAAAAVAFYTELFGWEKQGASEMEGLGLYQEFGRGGTPLGGIYTKPGDMPAPPHWLPYVRVPDIRASVEAATSRGGQLLNGPMEIPGGDRVAQLSDPQGALFALHQTKA
jgi:predicted enzyme related to lactoylglutathione lyase